MKSDLSDVTFIIPLRIDSIARVENLLLVTDFLFRNFFCNIKVLEAGNYENGIVRKLLDKSIDYKFIEDRDPVFHRTKYLNLMIKKSTTTIVGIWDADVLMNPIQIEKSVEQLRAHKAQVAYPYDGRFMDTSLLLRELYLKSKDLKTLDTHVNKMIPLFIDRSIGTSIGGAFIVNKVAYIKSGLENEEFYGWGPEDSERYQRWISLKYTIYRAAGCLYHLSHFRGTNSAYHSIKQAERKINMVKQNKYSSEQEILKK